MLSQDPETGRITYEGNVTMTDALVVEPRILYARCVNARNRPAAHRGDWPVEGVIYPVRVLQHPKEPELNRLAVLTLEGEWPFYNVFAAQRFEHVATIWPN